MSNYWYLLALASSALAGCAATEAQQGEATQGGSNGPVPTVVINIGTQDGTVTISNSPTAAPAAKSEAQAKQEAKQETKPKVDPKAVADAFTPDVPLPTPDAEPTPEPTEPE